MAALEGRRGLQEGRRAAWRRYRRKEENLRGVKDIEPTGRIVLRCGCGERVVLLGSREDWLSEGRDSFECGGCGSELPLPDEGDEKEQGNDEPGDADPHGLSIGEYVKTLKAKKTG